MCPSPTFVPLRRNFPGVGFALCLALCLALLAPCAFATENLGFFASRRVLSDADGALASGKLDSAVDLYTQVIEGTEEGNGRHVRALLGAAVAELGRDNADTAKARQHLNAYVASYEAEQKGVARALLHLLDREEPSRPPVRPTPPPTDRNSASEDAAASADAEARIADLERELAAAQRTIAEKEQLIEELRKIVVEGGG